MWSDNDIDNAFQRLNPPEPEPTPFPLDAWLRLEDQLDKAVIERAVRRRVWRLFAAEVAIVALLALGWLLWPSATTAPGIATRPSNAAGPVSRSTSRKPERPDAVLTAPAAALPPAALDGLTTKTNSAAVPVSSSTALVQTTTSAQTLIQRESSATRKPARQAQQPGAAIIHTTERRRNSQQKARETATYGLPVTGAVAASSARHRFSEPASRRYSAAMLRQDEGVNQAQSVTTVDTPPAAAQLVETTNAAENAVADNAATPAVLAPRAVAQPLPVPAELPAPLATVAVAEPTPKLPAAVRQPRFYIGVVGAPDVSTVKFADVQSPMLNLGLTLEYRISQRLRISTGLLRANKEYYARREDYDWTNYPRAATRDFTWVDGACTVFDVPLNLRYDAVAWPQARLFGSAGLSSFFMHRERYSYDYVDNNQPSVWERDFTNENQHLFSVLNLSAGYERSLSNRWSLQAEPYLKLPLAGVGAGKVKLTSAGVFLGVKYGF